MAGFRNITEQLIRRGYSEGDIRKVLGENALRVLASVERAAAEPSERSR